MTTAPGMTEEEIAELEKKFGQVILWAQMTLEQSRWDRAKAGHQDIAFTKADGSVHAGLWQDEWDAFVAVRDGVPRLLSSLKHTKEEMERVRSGAQVPRPFEQGQPASAASLVYEELLRTRGWARKMRQGLDGLLDWVMEAHKEDGWNSLSTPDAVVVAYGALTDANIPAFALDLSIEPEPADVRERLASAVRDMTAAIGKPNTIISLQTHAHWLTQEGLDEALPERRSRDTI